MATTKHDQPPAQAKVREPGREPHEHSVAPGAATPLRTSPSLADEATIDSLSGPEQEELIAELARCYADRDTAVVLLTKAGFPAERLPPPSESWVFWHKVVESIRNGAPPGMQPILLQAARRLERNAVFARHASPLPGDGEGPHTRPRPRPRAVFLASAAMLPLILMAWIVSSDFDINPFDVENRLTTASAVPESRNQVETLTSDDTSGRRNDKPAGDLVRNPSSSTTPNDSSNTPKKPPTAVPTKPRPARPEHPVFIEEHETTKPITTNETAPMNGTSECSGAYDPYENIIKYSRPCKLTPSPSVDPERLFSSSEPTSGGRRFTINPHITGTPSALRAGAHAQSTSAILHGKGACYELTLTPDSHHETQPIKWKIQLREAQCP